MLVGVLGATPAFAQDAPDPAASAAAPAAEKTEKKAESSAIERALGSAVGEVNKVIGTLLFFSVTGDMIQVEKIDAEGQVVMNPSTGKPVTVPVGVPFIVVVLILGAIFFTFWYRWINIRGFKHAVDIVRGKYDNPEDEGEISHFRALTSALSATVGLGNIAGVAIAIQLGGPGAVFWMLVAAVFGMSAKFSECTLAQVYRKTNADGTISGGPMYYLDIGLKELGIAPLGKVLAIMYAFMLMGGSFGGGNMFQSNQSWESLRGTFGLDPSYGWVFGLTLGAMVALVIIGGIKRIGAATSKLVPAMVAIYCLASLFIIVTNIDKIPASVGLIFSMAFSDNAAYGGVVGVLVWGVKRASFSNEAGLGSAAIAHAAAKTDEPVREGMVAMMGPFIDTIIVCFMTAIVVIVTGAWSDPSIPKEAGVALTTAAFGSVISWFPYVLAICVLLFAYSTMISWSYYGERGWIYLLDHFGDGLGIKTLIVYRITFVGFVVLGSVIKLKEVLDFSDLMILCMAFPNIVGSVFLAPKLLGLFRDYWGRYTSGKMPPRDAKPSPAE